MTNREKYPNVPDHALPPAKKFKTSTANGLTNFILDWCNNNGVFCRRISSEGRYRPGDVVTDVIGQRRQMAGKWLPGLNVGLPDLFIIYKGQFIGLEIKIGNDRQSDVQKKTQAAIIAAGGNYVIIKTKEDFNLLTKVIHE